MQRVLGLGFLCLACSSTPSSNGTLPNSGGNVATGGSPSTGGGPNTGGNPGAGGAAGAPAADAGPTTPVIPAPGTWIHVQAGSFVEGAGPNESCNINSENQFLHAVTLTHDYELAATEVTYADYATVFGAPDPHYAGCDDCPVNLATWHRAAAICNRYSEYAGLTPCYTCSGDTCETALQPHECHGYRLATESEWEYAYRATTTTPIYNGEIQNCSGFDTGIDAIAWYLYNSSVSTHPVATKQANAWGFYDMSGNVWEWTHDGYVTDRSTLPALDPVGENTEGVRVMRGGSYNCVPQEIRGAHRSGLAATISGLNVGLRCARTL
jgi:formylglycine-generating enzyme required for sulfatase activity